MTELQTVTDVDGIEVAYRRWLPDGDARALVLVLHGMSEHGGRYARFAAALVASGLAAYAPDHRGHGDTGAGHGTGTTGPNGFAGAVASIRAVHEQAMADLGDVPTIVFGHSMGSVLAQAYTQAHADHLGIVLSGAMGPTDELAVLVEGLEGLVAAGAGDEPLAALGGFNDAFEPARTPYDWLSRDAAEVDAYIADPYCGDENPVTTAFVAGLLGLLAGATTEEAIGTLAPETPVLFVTGDADPVSNGGDTVRTLAARYEGVGHAVETHFYPDARHEVLNETNRDEVTADVVGWIDRVLDR